MLCHRGRTLPARSPTTESRLMRAPLLLALLLLTGCGPKTGAPSAAGASAAVRQQAAADGTLLVQVDVNNDGRADIYNHYRSDGESRVLSKKEMDLNRDGRIDVWSWYNETGVLEKEEMDGDFDGVVDWVDHYQGGRRVMSEVSTQASGRFDLFKYYENGKIRRKERDTNGDGKVDFWEYFDDAGHVSKVGWDVDGDGQMDVREE